MMVKGYMYPQMKKPVGMLINSIKSTCTNLNVLSKILTEDIPIDSDQSGGLLLDEAQIKLLANSWRSKTPERLTCFREDYRN
jgi:hypothetical protein